MVRSCMYPGCCNRCKSVRLRAQASGGDELTFHRFPLKDPERLKLWLLAIRWDVNTPMEKLYTALMCSEHFSSDDFEPFKGKTRRLLKPTAVPLSAHLFLSNENPSKDPVPAQPSLYSTATDEYEETDVQGASVFFKGVPQSTPVKPRHIEQSAGIDTGLHLMLASPEADASETRPSTSGAYIAFPPMHSFQSIAVNQLQFFFQPKLCCEVSCQTEVFTRDAACQTGVDPLIKHSISTQCTWKSEHRNESTQIKQREKRVSCSSHTSPLKRPRREATDDVTNLSICDERVCRKNLSAPSNRKLQKSTHVHASTKKKTVLIKLKSEYQLKSEDQLMPKDQRKSEDQLDQDICRVSVASALQNADIVSQSPTSMIKVKETERPESRLVVRPVAISDKIDHNYVRTPNPVTMENRVGHRDRPLGSKKSHLTGLFQTCLQCGGPVLEYTTISSGSQNRLQWKCSKGHLMWLFPNTNPS